MLELSLCKNKFSLAIERKTPKTFKGPPAEIFCMNNNNNCFALIINIYSNKCTNHFLCRFRWMCQWLLCLPTQNNLQQYPRSLFLQSPSSDYNIYLFCVLTHSGYNYYYCICVIHPSPSVDERVSQKWSAYRSLYGGRDAISSRRNFGPWWRCKFLFNGYWKRWNWS